MIKDWRVDSNCCYIIWSVCNWTLLTIFEREKKQCSHPYLLMKLCSSLSWPESLFIIDLGMNKDWMCVVLESCANTIVLIVFFALSSIILNQKRTQISSFFRCRMRFPREPKIAFGNRKRSPIFWLEWSNCSIKIGNSLQKTKDSRVLCPSPTTVRMNCLPNWRESRKSLRSSCLHSMNCKKNLRRNPNSLPSIIPGPRVICPLSSASRWRQKSSRPKAKATNPHQNCHPSTRIILIMLRTPPTPKSVRVLDTNHFLWETGWRSSNLWRDPEHLIDGNN